MKLQFKLNITKNNIKNGDPGNAAKCPVALALKDLGFKDIHVSIDSMSFITKNDTEIIVTMPKKVFTFICKFDSDKSVNPFSIIIPL